MTTCVSDVVLAVANTLLLLLLVMYVLSDKLVTVSTLVVVIVGDGVHCISENIHTILDYLGINFYSQTEIEVFPPSSIIFSALTVMTYEVSHDTLLKVTLVSNDSVIADDEMLW